MNDICVRLARPPDRDRLASLRSALWPESSAAEHASELTPILSEIDLRSHADGCNPSRPVGYVEGWFVAQEYRRQRVGAKLLAAAEDWARSHGCVEMASDTWIDNEVSQRAHEALGFEVVDRCVHYRKNL